MPPLQGTMRRRAWCALVAFVAAAIPAIAVAAPPTPAELTRLCGNAEDQAHCGRLVEARQLGRLKDIVTRDGDELRIDLLPGTTVFRDAINISGARSYAVWDYIDDLKAIVLFATSADRTEFWIVQREGGAESRIPSEPVLAPDRRRLATADFCGQVCDNEVAVWRIDARGVRKELAWAPREPWTEASVAWKNADTIVLRYVVAGDAAPRMVERRLNDPAWTRPRP
jgi:hypothetical protein